MKASQGTLAGVLGGAANVSVDLGNKINRLVDTGAITRLQDSFQKESNLNLPILEIQAKLAQTVQLGIPKEFLDNLNRISNLSVPDYTVLSEDETALFENQIEQNLAELDEQLNENPAGIWGRLNEWATGVLEATANLKEKQPFIFLILQIMFLIGTFVFAPAVQDVIKERVLHELNLTEEDPAKNARDIKKSLSKELDGAASLINEVRVTNKETPVFRSDKRKSGQIDSIQINRPVIILNKKRNWCFIMYTNQFQEEVAGWVFTGNLVR